MIELKPTKEAWTHYKDAVARPLLVIRPLAELMSGGFIPGIAENLLRDLGLLTPNGEVNRKGQKLVGVYLKAKIYNYPDDIKIIKPEGL